MLYLVKNLLQILKNLNIISTGVLYRIILKKKSDHVLQTPIRGWVMAIVMALLSGFAGVYTEVIIKKNPSRNINAQNFWLYIFGMLFNLVAICVQDFDAVMNKGFFHGEVYMSTTIIWIKNISKMLPAQTMMQEELLPSLKMQKSECLLTNLKTP
ncbi:CMP-sialic acid transporter 4 [Zea mays]|uniref:CMP-sialic acid transporter 4 n=1 Tax=Zea mays TaxID=4577 RepID=A0A1D6MXC4_MAIZE|nr:CMP-sialic acid transporter 4 [Zea mays]